MDKKRREFLKIAGVSTLAGLGGIAVAERFVSGASPASSRAETGVEPGLGSSQVTNPKDTTPTKRLGMVIDLSRFKNDPSLVGKVISACHTNHNVPNFPDEEDAVKWVSGIDYEIAFGEQSPDYTEVLVLCNHCDNPPCVEDCPTRATFIDNNGIVAIDYHRCIGCRFCVAACPYGMRSFNWRDPREGLDMNTLNREFPTRRRGVVENCNFCAERLGRGQMPACVEVTSEARAIVVGDLNDPNSEINIILGSTETKQRMPLLGTNPSVFYIV
ncbi:MAG: 4Fe-4S dicluster domain-containing protein [Proteobacteria bacterium]|nr:4Fe-4S dicluster domain-containing protein [Pseudomonadota bacterium]MBU1060096.1 4Fe-4S dicluster domain-containing protein [Pseudomonadota bacterium]